MQNKKILIVAGEASGDLHAANLVKAIKDILPQAAFFGLGGKKLKEQGVNLYCDIVELAVVGFFEVLKNLNKFRSIFKGILEEIDEVKPDLTILVDYPGFNLRLAAELKKRGIPVIYYISPQVWAWGQKRIETIKKLVTHMIVVFKFEEELYKKHGIPATFVGHPLLDIIKPEGPKTELANKLGVNLINLTFALLPGSREKEVKTLLPIMLETAKLISIAIPNSQFLILRSSTVEIEIFDAALSAHRLTTYLITDMTYDGLRASDFALVASGTATLETAILGIPMVILYKTSFFTWLFAKAMIKIPYIGLVNVVSGRKIIEEFIQYQARPRKIADYIVETLNDKEQINQIKHSLSLLTSQLGEKEASFRAAKIVINLLKSF